MKVFRLSATLISLCMCQVLGFLAPTHNFGASNGRVLVARSINAAQRSIRLQMSDLKEREKKVVVEDENLNLEETTEKFGLEAGLFQAFKKGGKNSGSQAKELLKRYGSAYLITSITFALISFTICYILVDNGVDIAGLLNKVGIDASATTEKAGTVAVAYAAHKAASPIRFPPTVALTPVVAKLLGKEVPPEESSGGDTDV